MALQDKTMLMQKIDDTLKPKMFANLLEEAENEIQDHLNCFDIQYNGEDGEMYEGKDDFLTAYISAKRTQGMAESTLFQYERQIVRFLEHTKLLSRNITNNHVRDYLAYHSSRGLEDSTIENMRLDLSTYFSWLEQERLIRINPMRNIGVIKYAEKARDPFTEAEIEQMRRFCHGSRNRAIFNTLISTGCRISEVTGLNIEDIDLTNAECLVCGKGDKERTAFFDEIAVIAIQEYLNVRKSVGESVRPNDPLFFGRGSRRLEPNGVRAMLKQLEKKSGVKNIHPHRFRHTLITKLLNRGMPIQEVAALVGHDKIDTTMHYYHKSKNRVKGSYLKYAS